MMSRYKPVGWRGESYRHYLAGKGVCTKKYLASKRSKMVDAFTLIDNPERDVEARIVTHLPPGAKIEEGAIFLPEGGYNDVYPFIPTKDEMNATWRHYKKEYGDDVEKASRGDKRVDIVIEAQQANPSQKVLTGLKWPEWKYERREAKKTIIPRSMFPGADELFWDEDRRQRVHSERIAQLDRREEDY